MSNYIYDDRPIIDSKFDKLGFTPAADALAELLAHTNAPEGFVASVTGEWGSGKSSFLNFVEKSDALYDPKNGLPKLEIIHFDPWIISGHQDLVSAFFKHLSDELKSGTDVVQKTAKLISAEVAQAAKSGVDTFLSNSAAKIALLADGGLLAKPASFLAQKSLDKVVLELSKVPSLQKVYKTLSDQLRQSGRRFLIIIDEIDRLSPEEIRTMMNMVKSVGRLPNIIYLLSYDRSRVNEALGRGDATLGQEFAEKIVQHEMRLPSPIVGGALSILNERVTDLLSGTEDDTRWYYYVTYGLHRWINKPRDAVRLACAFNFIARQLESEVDLQDILILEGLRLFQPEVFEWVRDNDAFLFGSQISFLTEEDKKAKGKELSALINEAHRSSSLKLLTNIFPQITKSLPMRYSGSGTSYYHASIKGFVQSEQAYRAYFAAGLPEGHVSKKTLDMLASPSTTVQRFNNVFSDIDPTDSKFTLKVSSIVEAIRFRVEDSAKEMPFAVLDGLGAHYIEISHASKLAGFFSSPLHHFIETIRTCLEAWGEARTERYADHVLASILPLEFKSLIVTELACSIGQIPTDRSSKPLIKVGAFKKIKALALSQIEEAAHNGTLATVVDIYRPLKLWSLFGSAKATKEWTHLRITTDKEVLYKICYSLVSRTLGRNIEYTLRENPSCEYVDLLPLVAATQNALAERLSPDQKKLFLAIIEGSRDMFCDLNQSTKH